MRAHAPELPAVKVSCSACGRAVESDVMDDEQLVAAIGWARIDDRVLCVSCRRTEGCPADLLGRVMNRR